MSEVKFTESVLSPEQMVWDNAVFVKVGTGLTVKVLVAVTEAPQSFITTNDTV